MSSPKNAQYRKDSARVLQVMAGLPAPLVSYCLDSFFGPDLSDSSASRGRKSGSRPSSGMSTPVSSRPSSFDGSRTSSDDGDSRRFRLRKMNSGNWGQYSLAHPVARRKDMQGFQNQPDLLTFDLQIGQ